MSEEKKNYYQGLIEHAAGNPKPNWTHYQFAVTEISEHLKGSVETAAANRALRNMMEQKFGLETLDSLVDLLKVD